MGMHNFGKEGARGKKGGRDTWAGDVVSNVHVCIYIPMSIFLCLSVQAPARSGAMKESWNVDSLVNARSWTCTCANRGLLFACAAPFNLVHMSFF